MKNYTSFLQFIYLPMAVLFLFAMPTTAENESNQMSFRTAEEAVDALVQAVKENNIDQLVKIFGPEIKTILDTGETAYDNENRERFLKAYENEHQLESSSDKTTMILSVGKSGWQFPIPLVKDEKGYHFDMKTGLIEIQNRRIGRNELSTIQALLAYVDAQREYYALNPEKNATPNYANKFMSTEGKRDGLYYPVLEGEKGSPLGELYARAQASGRLKEKAGDEPQPYYGYYYRILSSQGPDAAGGEYSYVVNGKLFGGHAAIAWPVSYGESGIMTFMVNHDGVVYEKDLGADTAHRASEITAFNPDKTWARSRNE